MLLGVLQTEHFVIAEFETCKNPRLSKFSLKQSTVACNFLLETVIECYSWEKSYNNSSYLPAVEVHCKLGAGKESEILRRFPDIKLETRERRNQYQIVVS